MQFLAAGTDGVEADRKCCQHEENGVDCAKATTQHGEKGHHAGTTFGADRRTVGLKLEEPLDPAHLVAIIARRLPGSAPSVLDPTKPGDQRSVGVDDARRRSTSGAGLARSMQQRR